jgi:hypothetical protein
VDVGTLISLVLGALLATLGGIATELWRQRRERRSAARLVYHEMLLNYGVLLAVRSRDSDAESAVQRLRHAVWDAHAEKLALTQELDDWQRIWGAYEIFAALPTTIAKKRETVTSQHLDLMLDAVEEAALRLGRQAGVPENTLHENRRVRLVADLAPNDRVAVWNAYTTEGVHTADPDGWLRERVAELQHARPRADGDSRT